LITNASLLYDRLAAELRRQPNVIPIISLEGYGGETDDRRGSGVFRGALAAMERMSERRMFFGVSIMMTKRNYSLVTGREFVRDLIRRGCRLFFYVDYVPIEPRTEYLVPTDRQRGLEPLTMSLLRTEFPALFVASSASEEAYGGCMAAGKGFVHVSPEGDLEPCPFAPFSDTSLKDLPLGAALRSSLLRKIRESDEHLSESEGGCALWQKRNWIEGLQQGQANPLDPVRLRHREESACRRMAA
jgi:MoaA/NifB/PqqE/SkfB family radical SAM enzyme